MILPELELVPITIKSIPEQLGWCSCPWHGQRPAGAGRLAAGRLPLARPSSPFTVSVAYQSSTRADAGTCDTHRGMSCLEQRGSLCGALGRPVPVGSAGAYLLLK